MTPRRPLLERLRVAIKPPEAQDTVRILPPGSRGCHGVAGPRPGKPIDLCRGCLRWQSRATTPEIMTPLYTRQQDGEVWCQDRIGD